MRLPNSYGSVYKLSGNRRNPWAARKTVGWTFDPEKKCSYPKYDFIGYYKTRAEALQALAEFNADPHDLHHDTITFAEIYGKWSDTYFEKIAWSNVNSYKHAYNVCKPIHDMPMVKIKLDHMQKVVDESGKNTPSLVKVKSLFSLLFEYAEIHEIVEPGRRDLVKYVDISKAGNPNAITRTIFTTDEIADLWERKDDDIVKTILMLIYTGVRIREMLDLKKEHVNIAEKYFDVVESKTAAGIRRVPISDKVLPFFEYWIERSPCEYLLCSKFGKHYKYANYKQFWSAIAPNHRPHDTRHTCISLLASAKIDERIIKKIVGHKGHGVTETIYTHFEIRELLAAINQI